MDHELFVLYDEKGEMFEVPASVAKRLIIDNGWTLSPPTTDSKDDLPLFSFAKHTQDEQESE